jgi:hypothetical protein
MTVLGCFVFLGYRFGISCDRFGISCDRFGISCDRFGISCDRFGLNCDRFGLSCDRLRLSCDSFGLSCDRFGLQFSDDALPDASESSNRPYYKTPSLCPNSLERNRHSPSL